MSNIFKYSVLQYKHSLVLGESLNVGIVFYFPNEDYIHFEVGNLNRVKSIYNNVDLSAFNLVIKNIKNRVTKKEQKNLFSELSSSADSFSDKINSSLIQEDTSLQFTDQSNAVNTFDNPQKTIEEFSKILLNVIEPRKEENKHDESYLVKKCSNFLVTKYPTIENLISKNRTISSKGVKLNFELSWLNGETHLVKPIAFDLKDEKDIQTKSVTFFGYLDLLNDYAKINNCKFDLLVSKPQNVLLENAYRNALDVLNESPAHKKIIQEEEIQEYSFEAAEILLKKAG